MSRVLIVGGRGQLGRSLQTYFASQPTFTVQSWQRPENDVTQPQIVEQLADLRPDIVINAAAWTNVDGAESNVDAAYAANALGPQYLAEGCQRAGALLIHVSTNEVFAGEEGQFYREYDQPSPRAVYARSKAAGERAVQLHCQRWMIVRVAWLFGPGGNNFPAKIAAAADRNGALRVVSNEIGNPTYAPDVAQAIGQLIEADRAGIYHLVNEGYTSRYELARTVLAASGRTQIPLTPISASDWPRPAPPPLHAVLVNQTAAALGIKLRPWQEAAKEYALSELVK